MGIEINLQGLGAQHCRLYGGCNELRLTVNQQELGDLTLKDTNHTVLPRKGTVGSTGF